MRTFVIAAAVTAALGVAGVIGWQANAAVPAGSIPHAGTYTPILHVGCRGGTGSHGCGPGGLGLAHSRDMTHRPTRALSFVDRDRLWLSTA
jgi:hypothetical protein